MEPLAKLVYRDDHQIIVACPYCMSTHRHGDGGMTDVSGNSYSSHCHNGSYRVFGTFDFRTAMIALRRREADLKRKRAAKKTECKTCNDHGEYTSLTGSGDGGEVVKCDCGASGVPKSNLPYKTYECEACRGTGREYGFGSSSMPCLKCPLGQKEDARISKAIQAAAVAASAQP
jgi:hypothetical protein